MGSERRGRVRRLSGPKDLKELESQPLSAAAQVPDGYLVVDPDDWKIIPMENLVAAAQQSPGVRLIAAVRSSAEAGAMLVRHRPAPRTAPFLVLAQYFFVGHPGHRIGCGTLPWDLFREVGLSRTDCAPLHTPPPSGSTFCVPQTHRAAAPNHGQQGSAHTGTRGQLPALAAWQGSSLAAWRQHSHRTATVCRGLSRPARQGFCWTRTTRGSSSSCWRCSGSATSSR